MADLPRPGGEAGSADPAFERLARVAAQALNAPLALIALPDHEGRYLTWSAGCEPAPVEVGEEGGFTWKLPAPDGRRDPLTLTTSNRQPGLSAHQLSRPVNVGEGERAGMICIADWEPRAWTQEEMILVQDLVALVEREIQFRSERHARQTTESRLEHAEQAQGQLAAALRHGFGQPLTVIQGFSELMGESSLSPEEVREYAMEINKEAAHLARMLAQTRDAGQRSTECAASRRSDQSWPESSS